MYSIIHLDEYPIKSFLNLLLIDKTTKRNIVFGTNSYEHLGPHYYATEYIEESSILGLEACEIQPRITKTITQQTERTKFKAEVFTPSWVCNKMINTLDEEWFSRTDVFNFQIEDRWVNNEKPLQIPKNKTWEQYIDLKFLEISCGEAPFIVSRYDTSTGEILSIDKRIGILDSLLRS